MKAPKPGEPISPAHFDRGLNLGQWIVTLKDGREARLCPTKTNVKKAPKRACMFCACTVYFTAKPAKDYPLICVPCARANTDDGEMDTVTLVE